MLRPCMHCGTPTERWCPACREAVCRDCELGEEARAEAKETRVLRLVEPPAEDEPPPGAEALKR